MIFKSRFRNLRYVIDPVHKNVISGIITHTPGFTIEFTGARDGTFDSSTIADEEKRARAEEYLLHHPDNGKFYHLIQEEEPQKVLNTCIGVVEGEGVCGKPTEPQSDYCLDCARELVRA